MKKNLLYLAAALAMVVGCHSDIESVVPQEEETQREGVWFKVPSLIDGDSQDTKALYSDGEAKEGFEFRWTDGDYISVYTTEKSDLKAPVQTINSDDPSYALFSGGGFSLTAGKTYYAFYPYTSNGTYDAVPFSLTNQTLSCTNSDGAITNFTANDFCWATANCSVAGSASFNFKHICAFVKMELTLPAGVESVNKVTIGTTESIFTTSGTVNLSSGSITDAAYSNTIVLDGALDVDDNQKMTAYFALAPVDISRRAIYIIANGDNGKKYSVTFMPGTYELEAGKVYTTLFKRTLVLNEATYLSEALKNGGTVLASLVTNDLSSSNPITLTKNVGLVVDADLTIPTGSIIVGDKVVFTIMGGGTKTMTKSTTKGGTIDAPTLTVENGGIVNTAGAVAIDGATVKLKDDAAADSYAIENQRVVRVYSGEVTSSQNIVKNTKGSYDNAVQINGGEVTAAKNVVVNVAAVAQATSTVDIAGGDVTATSGAIVKNEAASIPTTASSKVNVSYGSTVKVGTAIVVNAATNAEVAASKNEVTVTGGSITIPTAAVVKNSDYSETPTEEQKEAGATVTGGTFKTSGGTAVEVENNNTVPAGYEQDKTTGEVKADENQLAQIGTAVYTTLTAAYEDATDGATIILLKNQTSGRIDVAKNITIDLNGFTLTGTSDYNVVFGITGGKTLTINGTTAKSKIDGCIMVTSGAAGNLVVNGGTYINTTKDITGGYVPFFVNGSCNEGNVWKISNATIGSATGYDMAIYQAGRCTTTLTDCTIAGSKTGIEVRAGSMTLKDCTVSGSTNESDFKVTSNNNGSTVEGGVAVAVSQHGTDYDVSLTIDGGSYTGYYALYETDVQNTTGNISMDITSGTFNGKIYSANCTKFIYGGYYKPYEPDDSYIADGYKATSIGSDTYRIDACTVAKIGNVSYSTIAKAFAAVKEGETITLVDDCETGDDYSLMHNLALEADNVTLNLNGYTLTTTVNMSVFIAGNNVTVKDGKIYAGDNSGKNCGYNSYAINIGSKDYGTGVTGVKFTNVEFRGGVNFGGAREGAKAETEYQGYGVGTIEDCTIQAGDFYIIGTQISGSTVTVLSGNFKKGGAFLNEQAGKGTIILKGGTYDADPSAYCATGYEAKANGTTPETWTVKLGDAVAAVGSVTYTDLHEALEAAKEAGKTCTLLRDINLKDVAWTPVADFKGTFDGGNYTISNLKITTGTCDLGLFASTSGATVKDLTISGASISGDTMTGSNIGVLVGGAGTSTLTNVTVTGSNINTTGKYVGGLVGNSSSEITGCSVTSSTIIGKDQVGGLVGYQLCNGVNSCTSTGNTITATEERAGGLIGKFEMSSGNDSYFSVKGNVVTGGSATAPDYAGGLMGQIMGDMSNYEIKNNSIDITLAAPAKNPIGNLRDDQDATYTGALAKNITGNTWTDETLKADYFEYTNVASGVVAQIISRVGFYKDEDDVYHISDLAGLKVFRDAVNADTRKEDTSTNPYIFKTATVKLDASIDMNNANWTPINCEPNNSFGTFDGNSKTISNFTVTECFKKHAGLFSALGCGTVKNLTVDHATVTGINHVGAIVGYGICAKFEYCNVTNSTVTAVVTGGDDGDKAGAICGYLSAEPTAYVRNCSAENCTITAYRDLGSLVGIANGAAEVSNSKAKNCSVICKTDNNYKNFTTKAEFDANEIVGETTSTATVSGNPATNVTVTYVPGFADFTGTTTTLDDWK